ncbi:MAG: polysaccharide biosynthesis protein [Acidobacteria bacterium]|nr:polysaccharide biosynthesis protein [Acidobacteriota bacterium]
MSTAPKPNQYLGTADLKIDLGLRTARGGAVTIASQGLKFFLSMFATVILARLLTPRDYGLVGMVAVVTGFIAIFKDLGLSSATIQRADLNEGQVSTLFWINISFSVLIMFVTVAISPLVAKFYGEPRLVSITIAYSAGFLLGGLTVQHEALLRRRMRFGGLAAAEIFALLVGLSTGIYLAWRGKNYWALVFSQLSQGLAYAMAVWLVCRWRPGLPVRNSGVRSLLAFGRNLTGFSIINYFARNLDNMLIGRFWGGLELGLYARAYQLLMLPIEQISAPITSVAIPALSRLTDSPERYRSAYVRLIEKIAILTMPLMVFMIATSDWVVLLLLGPKWSGVSRIFALLAIAGFIQPVSGTVGWLYVTQGRTRQMFQWGLIGSAIIIASIVVGLPWGAVGVAASYSITFFLLVTPLSIWYATREGPVRAMDFYRAIGPPAGASISALAALVAFRQWSLVSQPFVRLGLAFAIAMLVSLVVLGLFPAGRLLLRDLKGFAILLTRREEITTAI